MRNECELTWMGGASLVRKFKALAHPVRIQLLKDLMRKTCCVGEIQKCLSISQPNASQHLKILKEAGIVVGTRDKNKICYKIADAVTAEALKVFFKGEHSYGQHQRD